MSIFEKLLGRKKQASEPAAPAAPAAVVDPSQDAKKPIRAFDKYGRELFVTRENWRTNVLAGTIKTNWNNPEELYVVIVNAMRDGFLADVVDAAQQLYQIDTDPVRAACIWGIVLMQENRLDEAEKVLRDCVAKHGEDGSILTNLAKVYAKRNDDSQAEKILWHALEVDPNQENGFAWYESICNERGGETASLEAMRRVAALPGSWRAQLWLGRKALKSQGLEAALSFYRESLARATKPTPGDLLMQMSGDLGNAGYAAEILSLVEPQFDAAIHGLNVGNNLIKAHLDLDQRDQASRILNQLCALNRPDFKEHLRYWDTQIARARVAATSIDQQAELKMTMLTIAGPVWLKPDSLARSLFPPNSTDSRTICFLGGSATFTEKTEHAELQMSNAPGRISRALPFFLAEQIELTCYVRTQTLVPWIVEPGCGFVLSGACWSNEEASEYATQASADSDYVVVTHLIENSNSWTMSLRLVRIRDRECAGEFSESFATATPGDAARSLVQQLLKLLAHTAAIKPQPLPPAYTAATGAALPNYLLRLEQLLATRCGSMEGVPNNFLNGEREILDGNIQQCLTNPTSVNVRLLLAQTLLAMKRVRPDILPEFEERVRMLLKEHPLPESAQATVQQLCDEAFAA